MSSRSIAGVGLAVLCGLTACAEGPTNPGQEGELAPELALEQMAVEANRDGAPDDAAAYSGGALALRLGIRPSEIEVQIGDEKAIYRAVMVGIVRVNRAGERVLMRSLLAWTGTRRPTAILQVSSRSDAALFGHPEDRSNLADTPGRALGVWADLVNRRRWIATAGSADMTVLGLGNPCPTPRSAAGVLCTLAEFDIRITGSFVPARAGEPGEHLEIHTSASEVNGVVLGPGE